MADEVNRDVVYRERPSVWGATLSRVSWGAIWAGVMVALGMEALFALFGFFVGFNMYNAQAVNPWGGISVWSMVWYLITAGWSMFFGAWCTARLSGNPLRGHAILHGITTWGLATFATLLAVGVSSWAVLREGIVLLVTGAATPAGVGMTAQSTANTITQTAAVVWAGMMFGLITAIIGGWVGRPRTAVIEAQEVPGGPSRLAA